MIRNEASHGPIIATIILFGMLAGCSTTAPEPVPEVVAAEPVEVQETAPPVKPVPPEKPKPEDYPVAPFEGDALYELLVAEIAGYRSRYDIALEKYLAASEETKDPGVAARATRLALYLKDDAAALRTVRVWTEQEPENIDAHRHAVDLMLRAGRLNEAIEHMETVKNLGGLARFEVFAYRANTLTPEDQRSLLAVMDEMMDRHPGDQQLMLARAILLEQVGRKEEALVVTNQVLAQSDEINVLVLKVSLLTGLGRMAEARTFLQEKVLEMPDNRRLRVILARLLFEQNDLAAAQEQYLKVLEKAPNDGDVLFALALIALEQHDDATAQRYFERMVRWNRRAGEAHYYLGGIAERQSDKAKALREYRQAGDGYEFMPAQARIATLLIDDGQWDEARDHLHRMRQQYPGRAQQLVMLEGQILAERGLQAEVFEFLNAVLEKDPENIELLYFRAMTGQKFDRLDILEADLRRVITLQPNNADALNALGYTLTDQTDRHEEALELIEQALAIKPDEAAFIDSMGWVHYRLNNYELAITYLRRALSLFQNDEVAAHLGEVLWVVGNEAEALDIWDKALQLAPESDILKNVIQRFKGP